MLSHCSILSSKLLVNDAPSGCRGGGMVVIDNCTTVDESADYCEQENEDEDGSD